MATPKKDGGRSAAPLDWEVWREDHDEDYDLEGDEEMYEKVKEDIGQMRRYIKHAPKRRAVPPFCAPLELWHMVMFPNWRRRRTGGLGSPAKAPSNKMF
eukprot:2134389-Pyramimonas_sp.AAC.1